jgi:DNA polymerase-1
MPKSKPTLVLIDAHAFIHRAYHALPDLTTPTGEPVGALYGLAAILVKMMKDLAPDYAVAAYDLAGPTHRHEAYKEYKGTRAKIDDNLIAQLDRSREIFKVFHIPIYDAPGFEADDVIGTLATSLKKDYNVIIASGDMDTLQLVDDKRVQVFTMKKSINDTVVYDEDAVKERYGFAPTLMVDYKGLRGDPSDNIIGVPGIGEKTATTLITTFGGIEDIYKALKKDSEKFMERAKVTERIARLLEEHEEEAEFSKVLATIRTDAPVEFKKAEADWRKNFTADHAVELFTKLGFRSLIPRIQTLGDSPRANSGSRKLQAPILTPEPALGEPKTREEKEAAVMLWLTNSDLTNPTVEDVLLNTESATVEEAHEKLEVKIKKEDLEGVWNDIEKPLIPVVDAMNARGVAIDRKHLESLSKEYHKELDAIAKKIFKLAGEEFNINSPKQLGEILFTKLAIGIAGKRHKKTSTGQLSTKESELVTLKGEHLIIEEILQYRELSKLLGTYIDAIPPLLDAGGRLHTTFIQSGAATGRFASQNPGVQNIPIKTELGRRIRNAFVAPKGTTLITFDYSQIELRLAAILSGDEKMQRIFKNGEDVHAAVAAELFHLPPAQVTKEMRRRAKVINFGILYGMGVNALRENLGGDRAEAQAYLTRYFETFSQLSAYLTKTKATAARLGYTTTLFGRKRYFPGITSRLPFVRAQAERMAINAPLQGTQADIIKIAMVQIYNLINKEFGGSTSSPQAYIVLQIHDELMFEVTDSAVETFAPKAKSIMESVLTPEQCNGVPITVQGEQGTNWGEMEKI